MDKAIFEKLAALQHEAWMAWAKSLIAKEAVNQEIVDRWQQYLVPYDQLAEMAKDMDREFARKVLGILKIEDISGA